ncbi:MAG: RNA polymerase sigma factor [Planctomycetota bacterium]
MRQISAGQESALTRLLELHGSSLKSLILRLMAWHPDSDDVFQEVLVKVWNRAGAFTASGPLDGWLKRIAVNEVQNHFRTANRFKKLMDRFAEKLAGSLPNDTESRPNQVDWKSDLADALGKLNAKDRTAVVLFYLEGMTGQETADLMQIRLESLHVKLSRARKKLKSILSDTEAT